MTEERTAAIRPPVGWTDGRHLTLGHLYPEHMNLYGDRGNLLALVKRAEWRGIAVRVQPIEVGARWDPRDFDLMFLGGGEDAHQAFIADDFLAHRDDLWAAFSQGIPMLAICGGYQLLGLDYTTAAGKTLEGIGWLNCHTEAGSPRLIGDVVLESRLDISPQTLVGFENHGGRTLLGPDAKPLGKVLLGKGNNGQDGWEGATRGHVIGTYLHGSLLPKNPHLTDLLLAWALGVRQQDSHLDSIPSEDELRAHAVILHRGPK